MLTLRDAAHHTLMAFKFSPHFRIYRSISILLQTHTLAFLGVDVILLL